MTKNISQQGQRVHFDALVIGSGIAGLSYALELAKLKPHCTIALISKRNLTESNSFYAQGGIAAAQANQPSIQAHIQDTLLAGDQFCYQPAVEKIITAGPAALQQLIAHGVHFDQTDTAQFKLAQEGGHSERRVYHYRDTSGQAIIDALIKQIKKHPSIKVFTQHTAINLITRQAIYQPASAAEVIGCYILDNHSDLIHTFITKTIILATGGAGKVYRYTSNPDVATGDGIAMAYRAGAQIKNMEFYQFHPTLLYHTQTNNFLISEALRGEGAHLYLPHSQQRFMKKYAPQKMELATRDIVARAIFTEIENSAYNYVDLNIAHQSKDFLLNHFPNIYHTLLKLGIDITKQTIPVVPAAHYLCGGVLSDVSGKTDLTRLFAIGETACTGLHGANRLASNSLLEGVVMAKYAAQASSVYLDAPMPDAQNIKDWDSLSVINLRRASQINAHWRGLRGEMTSYAGIVRTQAGLKDLLRLIKIRRHIIEDYYWQHIITADLIELRNIILVAQLIAQAALQRQETRGGHYREDCQ